ncbi:MAG: hypothetical protein IH984_14075 [Planctomycetes bacterium]|nr:hypothetical protein [Planctomycetota bacterium]
MAIVESNTAILHFHTAVLLPADSLRRQEVARLQMTTKLACSIIDAMASHLDYYPKKADKSKEEKTNAKK